MGGHRAGPGGLRRWAAVCAAAGTVWLMGRTADLGALRSRLLGSPELVTAALELELGSGDAFGGWAELVVDQVPALSGEKEAVLAWQREQAARTEQSASGSETFDERQELTAETSAEEAPASSEKPERESGKKAKQKKEEKSKANKEVGPGDIQVQNETSRQKTRIQKYWNRPLELKLAPASEGPQILILHTHATEAYTMADGDNYEESDPERTTDEHYNVIRVGEEMKKTFEDMGLSVVHDKTTYDYPGYSGSYARSLAGAQAYLDQYPTIQVILDVHRDAILDRKGRSVPKSVTIDGEETAQVMLVVGTDDGGLKHPHWRRNYGLDLRIQGAMLEQEANFPRPIDLRAQRFNQHLRTGCTLVEVGSSGNTLRQALSGARRFARAAGSVYLGCVAEE